MTRRGLSALNNRNTRITPKIFGESEKQQQIRNIADSFQMKLENFRTLKIHEKRLIVYSAQCSAYMRTIRTKSWVSSANN